MNEAVKAPEIGFTDFEYQDQYIERSAKYIERMEGEGFVVLIPKQNELQIDIDTKEQYATVLRQLDGFVKRADVIQVELSVSRNGGRHIQVFTDRNYNDVERIALQASLGSDPLRELLSMFQYWDGDPIPSLLVELQNTEHFVIQRRHKSMNCDLSYLTYDFFNFKGGKT